MMRIAWVEIYFYFQDFLLSFYFTKVKIQSILHKTFVLINDPDIILMR